MFCRLVATHRICSKHSCAGVARFVRGPPYTLPSRTCRTFLRPHSGFARTKPAVATATAISPDESPLALRVEGPEAQNTSKSGESTRAASELARPSRDLKLWTQTADGILQYWKPFPRATNHVDDGIIDLIDKLDSIMSFESDDESANVPDSTYWNHLSHLLAYAYRSGSERAQHALDTYRYRAREFVQALPETIDDGRNIPGLSSIMIGCLANSAHDTLHVLSSRKRMPWYVRADCCYHLRYIAARWDEIGAEPDLYELYRQQIDMLKDRKYWKMTRLHARHLDLMLKDSSQAESVQLVRDWQNKFSFLTDTDALYLVGFYTKVQDVDNALKALGRVSPELLQGPNEYLIGRCVNLLMLDVIDEQSTSHSFRILPAMLKLGLPPLPIIHNMIVQNTAKAGLVGISLDLYRSLEAQGISRSSHTTTTLLKQSFLQRDLKTMDELMNMIHAQQHLARDPYLMAVMMNIVRHVCHQERKIGPEQCLSHLLTIWDRAYNRSALVRIGILRPDQVRGGDLTLPDAHPMALANMIWAFVLTQRTETPVQEVWKAVVHLLDKRDPQMTAVMDNAIFFNAFLIFYQRSPFTLGAMVEVLEYFLTHAPETLNETSWAIVINGLLKHEKDNETTRVQDMMRNLNRRSTSPALQSIIDRWPQNSTLGAFVRDVEAGVVSNAKSSLKL